MDRLKVCEAEGVEIRKEGFYSREMVQIWFKVLQWRRHSGETWNVEKKTASEEEEKRKSRV